jgi:hypothetical protein
MVSPKTQTSAEKPTLGLFIETSLHGHIYVVLPQLREGSFLGDWWLPLVS